MIDTRGLERMPMKTAALAILVLAAGAGPMHAADMYGLTDFPDEIGTANNTEHEQTVEIGDGWYLRGDISASFAGNSRIGSVDRLNGRYNDLSFKDATLLNTGVGYQFSGYLRSDVTLGYGQRSMNAVGFGEGFCSTGTGCVARANGKASVWELMANAYVDIPTNQEWGFSPYVGAGLGAARISYSGFDENVGCRTVSCGQHSLSGTTSWRPMWALMAGVSVPVSTNTTLDLGYRYNEIGSSKLARGKTSSRSDKGLASHDVRIGLRVNTW